MIGAIVLTASLVLALLLIWISLTMLSQMIFFVPFVPTPHAVGETMLDLADLQPVDRVCELGAGDARLMIAAKKRMPSAQVIGYEVARPTWLLGKLRLAMNGMRLSLYCDDFQHADLTGTTVVLCYLSPRYMRRLLKKFKGELSTGARIVSHGFPFKDITPKEVRRVRVGRHTATVYLYVW